MKNIKTVLKEWTEKVLSNVSEYDFEESAISQYGNNDEWERFFTDMAHSKGWDKVRKEKEFEDDEDATDYMIILLDRMIEERSKTV